jgi:hypothetical protein
MRPQTLHQNLLRNEKELYKRYLREKQWVEKKYPCYKGNTISFEEYLVRNYNKKSYII